MEMIFKITDIIVKIIVKNENNFQNRENAGKEAKV